MSSSGWGDWTNFAKTALSSAQKQLDKALDVREDTAESSGVGKQLQDDIFAAFGIGTLGGDSSKPDEEQGEGSQPGTSASWAKSVSTLKSASTKLAPKFAAWLGPQEGQQADPAADTDVGTAKIDFSAQPGVSDTGVGGGDWSTHELFASGLPDSVTLSDAPSSVPLLPVADDDRLVSEPVMEAKVPVELPLACDVQKEKAVANWLELVSPADALAETAQLRLAVKDEGLRECSLEDVFAPPSVDSPVHESAVYTSSIAETSSCSGCTLVEQPAEPSPVMLFSTDESWTDIQFPRRIRHSTEGEVLYETVREVMDGILKDVCTRVPVDDTPSPGSIASPLSDRALSEPGYPALSQASPTDSLDEQKSNSRHSANGHLNRKRPHPPAVSVNVRHTPTSSRSHSTEEVSSNSAANEQMLASIMSSDIEILSNPTPNNEESMSERSYSMQKGWVVTKSCDREPSSSKHRRTGSDMSSCDTSVGGLKKALHELRERNEFLEANVLKLQMEHKKESEQSHWYKSAGDKCKAENSVLVERCGKLEKELKNLQVVKGQVESYETEISSLKAEGEELAKQEARHVSMIKKLKEREKDLQKTIDQQGSKLRELEDLKGKTRELTGKDKENEKIKYQAQVTIEKQNEKINDLSCTIEDLHEQCATHKDTIERAYREIADLNKQKFSADLEVESLRKELADASNDAEKASLLESTSSLEQERQGLLQQVEDLRLSLIQGSEESSRKEEGLKWEIRQLQSKLQDAELRNEELSKTASEATKPLLRQMDSLQNSHQAQQSNWERLEKALYEKLREVESELAQKSEKEENSAARSLELKSRATKLEAQLTGLHAEDIILTGEVESELAQKSEEENSAARSLELKSRATKLEAQLTGLHAEDIILTGEVESELAQKSEEENSAARSLELKSRATKLEAQLTGLHAEDIILTGEVESELAQKSEEENSAARSLELKSRATKLEAQLTGLHAEDIILTGEVESELAQKSEEENSAARSLELKSRATKLEAQLTGLHAEDIILTGEVESELAQKSEEENSAARSLELKSRATKLEAQLTGLHAEDIILTGEVESELAQKSEEENSAARSLELKSRATKLEAQLTGLHAEDIILTGEVESELAQKSEEENSAARSLELKSRATKLEAQLTGLHAEDIILTGEVESELAQKSEKEENSAARSLELKSRATKLEAQLTGLHAECSKLRSELARRTQGESQAQENVKRLEEERSSSRKVHEAIVEGLNKEKDLLVSQFGFERDELKGNLERELRDMNLAMVEKDKELNFLRLKLQELEDFQPTTSSPPRPVSVPSSEQLQGFSFDEDEPLFDPLLASGSNAVFIDHLQSRLLRKQSEMAALKVGDDELLFDPLLASGSNAVFIDHLQSRLLRKQSEMAALKVGDDELLFDPLLASGSNAVFIDHLQSRLLRKQSEMAALKVGDDELLFDPLLASGSNAVFIDHLQSRLLRKQSEMAALKVGDDELLFDPLLASGSNAVFIDHLQSRLLRKQSEMAALKVGDDELLFDPLLASGSNAVFIDHLQSRLLRKQSEMAALKVGDDELLFDPLLASGSNAVFIDHLQSRLLRKQIEMAALKVGDDELLFDPLLASGSNAVFIDHLQSRLLRKQSEMAALKEEYRRLQATKESLLDQVSSMGAEQQQSKHKLLEADENIAQVQETENRYQTLLQMYGEKTEENEELRLDIQDMKEAYKTQIDDLLRQLS